MFGRVGSIGGAIVLLIALLAGIGNVYLKKSRVSDDYRKEAHALVEKCDCYSANKDYCDWLVDVTHDEVFEHSYKVKFAPGGRFRSTRDQSTFDEGAYAEELFDGMLARAKDDKAEAVVASLEKLKKQLFEEEPESAPTAPPPAARPPQRKK
ncbi:MAG: hypothetical protein KF691_14810 [Phycisphaeraceae bacterium]|nr:hypothetical protein [Phycisphaeraceae bacterium]